MIQTKEKERKQIENEKRRENEQNKTKILEESYKNLEKKYQKESDLNAKLKNEITQLKKENNYLKKILAEAEVKENILLVKIQNLQNQIKQFEMEENKNRFPTNQYIIKNSSSMPCNNTFPPILSNLPNERNMKKKCKSKEDLSPSIRLVPDYNKNYGSQVCLPNEDEKEILNESINHSFEKTIEKTTKINERIETDTQFNKTTSIGFSSISESFIPENNRNRKLIIENDEPEEISFNNITNENFRINHVPLPSLLKTPKDKEKKESALLRKIISKQTENLFEEFFVFGIKKEDLIENVENKNYEQITLPPKIIYSYPDPTENIKNSWKSIIAEFAFPFGVPLQKINVDRNFTQISQIIFASNISEQNSKTFLFNLKSEESYLTSTSKDKPVLYASNPNKILYGICFQINDFYEITDKNHNFQKPGNRKDRKFWLIPRVYCFLTYYPFMKLFIDVIVAILNSLKLKRIKIHAKCMTEEQEILRDLDGDFMLLQIFQEAENILSKIYLDSSLNFEKLLCYQYNNKPLSFLVPKMENCYLLESRWGCALMFSAIPFEDFFFLLFSILLEHSVLFVSENLCLLTSTLMTFHSLLKPFKWPYPIIFNLPESMLPLLASPIPVLFGFNQNLNYLKERCLDESSSYLIYYLDNKDLILPPKLIKEIGCSLPVFSGTKSHVRKLYESINPDPSPNFQKTDKKKKEKNGFKQYNENDMNLIYNPSANDEMKCTSLVQAIKDMLYQHIIKSIPASPVFLNKDNKHLDYQKIEKQILGAKPLDQCFFSKFVKSQIFSFYLQEFYELE